MTSLLENTESTESYTKIMFSTQGSLLKSLESYVSYGEFWFAFTLFSVFVVEIVGIAHFLH